MSLHDFDAVSLVPGLRAHPRLTLGHAPTPLDSLPRLGAHLGITLWAKRDDCNGLAFGGNKVRQLEYYFGRGKDQSADTVLITGALQSNFVRLTAAAACRLGWRAHVQLEDRVPKDDPIYRSSGNILLDRLFGAHIHHFAEGEDDAAADRNLDAIAETLRAQGRNPFVIHLGMDHPPYGGLGYVAAAAEAWQQLRDSGERPTHIVIPSGSGLTHAGFLVGARALDWQVPIHGICVRRGAEPQRLRLRRRAAEISALIARDGIVREEDILLHDEVLAPGYGRLNEATHAAIRAAATREGLVLDPVYSGRCMAGLMHLVETGAIPAGAKVLFIHTGGSPAVFAYQKDLEAANRLDSEEDMTEI
jgi:D-cysteine desulfhydrase/L-cysteate sulfo-lyase